MLRRIAGVLVVGFAASVAVADDNAVLNQTSGHKSPEAAFEAYKKATNEKDWSALFHLGTAAWQRKEIWDVVFGADNETEQDLHALFSKHGVDLQSMAKETTAAESKAAGNAATFVRLHAQICERAMSKIADKGAFFSAVQEYQKSSGAPPSPRKVIELRKLVSAEHTAEGEFAESVLMTITHPQGNNTRSLKREVTVTSWIYFRQVNGEWYIATEEEVAELQRQTNRSPRS